MEDIAIRRATAADAPALTAAFAAAYAPVLAELPDLPDVTGGLAEDIRDRDVWVAERAGRVLGGVVLDCAGGAAKIANLAVHPDAAGQGLARALIDAALAHARGRGFGRAILSTHREMAGNLALYRHLGWRVTGARGNTVTMERRL